MIDVGRDFRLGDVSDLPAVLTTAQLSQITGIGERTWWEVARGEATSSILVEPIRVGRRGVLRWPTAPILRALGLSGDDRTSTSPEAAVPKDQLGDCGQP